MQINGEDFTLRNFVVHMLQVVGLLLGFVNNKNETGSTYAASGENKKCIQISVGTYIGVDAMIILK
jgi:hypothetical protein